MPRLFSLILIAVAALTWALPEAAVAQNFRYTVYQKNMAFGNNQERRLANDILQRNPDAVTLQEVNGDNQRILDMIAGRYPSQKWCRFDGIGGVAVASRWPLIQGSAQCIRPLGATAIEVMMPEGPTWVISVHLETRDLPRHERQARRLGEVLAEVRDPIIIAGDFNDAPQSGPVRDVARGAGVLRIGDAITTRRVGPAGLIGVPIDFVFATGGSGSVEQLPMLGSDHYGLLATFTMRR